MWAMIACSIALAIWTTGMMHMTHRDEKKMVAENEETLAEKSQALPEKV
jgi:ACS family pantothenate transporter-like MFS transporter